MCGDGDSVGLDLGRACQGEARHSESSVGNLQAFLLWQKKKGTAVPFLRS